MGLGFDGWWVEVPWEIMNPTPLHSDTCAFGGAVSVVFVMHGVQLEPPGP